MSNDFEKEYDDKVYEDEFYEEGLEEEELLDEEEELKDTEREGAKEEDDEDEDLLDEVDGDERKVDVSYACEDCDYRWEDIIIKKKEVLDDYEEEISAVCPMCGSTNITLI